MEARSLAPVLRALRGCLHLLTAGLVALAAVRAVSADAPHAAAVVAVCATFAAMYGAGLTLPRVRRSKGRSALWLGLLCALWLVLLVLTPDALWTAFPLFFLQLHLLPLRWGVTAVAGTTAAAITGFVAHGAAASPGAVVGPALGAAVAIGTVLGYRALHQESERRRELIEELLATRAELAEAERAAGTLAERERLAREIHDTLAQGLSSIQLLLRAAERTLPEDAPALAHVREARVAAVDNLAEARRFVRALTPPDLEHGSLVAALERLCGTPSGATRVEFAVSGTPVELPTPYEVALLRVAQSALANTLRHADAERASITLSFMDTSVALDVVDDGRGFREEDARGTDGAGGRGSRTDGGFGLRAMRSRAQSLGGTLSVESTPGHGTALAITLPLPAVRASAPDERPSQEVRA
ncbi:sensor histidine kinase [Streptomyces cavernicola]|uniref:Oxygen sensor histidine kinase NreB n=1 Tax=Streptomyces cavernicola TaxID=3043613 RepID=A0ABT6SAS3_9ACTN|nr:sensor histidine kinase [Streptomyces sp. B-S-A6]MDI3405301.1 sensor histidine kinase [Streptomyces sp. B-S-A6]